MKVHFGLKHLPKTRNAVLTIGAFDGVHQGHQQIFHQMKQIATTISGETVVMTLWPHPKMVLGFTDENFALLSTLEEKIWLLEKSEIDHLLVLDFNQDLANTTAEDFVEEILMKGIGMKHMVIGYDHRFGKDRRGDLAFLQAQAPLKDFQVDEIAAQTINNNTISSTSIRRFIVDGQINKANDALAHPYVLFGKVIRGDQLGRTIGFPTANIQLENPYKLLPAQGVYAVQVHRGNGQWYNAMMNIGIRPTLGNSEMRLEVHLFDFNENLYGEVLGIHFFERLRSEKKFENLEALKAQLVLDQIQAKEVLKTKPSL